MTESATTTVERNRRYVAERRPEKGKKPARSGNQKKSARTAGGAGGVRKRRNGGLPINAQVFAALRNRIVAGEYAETGYLPPELELVKEFNVSRHTLRTALQKLVVDGLIERQRGRGTRIVRPDPTEGPWTVGSLEEMVGGFYGADYVSAEVVPASQYPDAADMFGIEEGGSLFRVVVVIKSPAGPQNYSMVLTRVEFGSRVPRNQIGSKFFLSLIEEHCGLQAVRARQVASAAIPPLAARNLLGLKEEEPALVLERSFFSRSGEPIEHIHLYCHPNNYIQIAEFYREVDMDAASR